MSITRPSSVPAVVLSVQIAQELDIVTSRQRARQLAALLGFGAQDQARFATAVSEIARNAYQHGGGGKVDFSIDLHSRPQFLWVEVSDRGPGIDNLEAVFAGGYKSPTGMGVGLAGSQRLMDELKVRSAAGQGTQVRFGKPLAGTLKTLQFADLNRICVQLAQERASGALDELQRQNRDLLQTLETIRDREAELERRQNQLARLNLELEETNRGVVALYAELDEKATALRRADEMKSRILRHVSHEFRTPVNSVLALTRLLMQRIDGDLSPEQEKQVGYIREAAQELAAMVNDLLDLAKVEAGKTELHVAEVEIGPFLGAVRALMRPLATNDAVALVFEESAPGLAVQTDESKLGQILRNLVSNALKFTQHGEVRISAHLSASRESVVLSVQDTGIGIAREDHERIFQEFAQVDHPIQKKVKGTGLGLPLSRKLATLLNGTLDVSSEPGKGSTFRLTLPLRFPQQIQAIQDQNAVPENDAGTILIIDDDEASRYIAHSLLRGTRHRIVEATDGTEGAERARFERPKLILLDLIMPNGSGFEVLDELKSRDETKDIPIVIQTSKNITDGDIARLGGRYAAILPKGPNGRLEALRVMRSILDEPGLFSGEPEFTGSSSERI